MTKAFNSNMLWSGMARVKGTPAARAAIEEGPEREGSQKKPSVSSRPSLATFVREL